MENYNSTIVDNDLITLDQSKISNADGSIDLTSVKSFVNAIKSKEISLLDAVLPIIQSGLAIQAHVSDLKNDPSYPVNDTSQIITNVLVNAVLPKSERAIYNAGIDELHKRGVTSPDFPIFDKKNIGPIASVILRSVTKNASPTIQAVVAVVSMMLEKLFTAKN